MIRFIVKRSIRHISGYEGAHMYTVDVEVPELEQYLDRGGLGEDTYEINEVVGVALLPDERTGG